MTYTATVDKIEDKGEDVEITTTNVRKRGAASWRSYSPAVSFRVPHDLARSFYGGRSVRISITPTKK